MIVNLFNTGRPGLKSSLILLFLWITVVLCDLNGIPVMSRGEDPDLQNNSIGPPMNYMEIDAIGSQRTSMGFKHVKSMPWNDCVDQTIKISTPTEYRRFTDSACGPSIRYQDNNQQVFLCLDLPPPTTQLPT